ncbi:MAG TPA: polysaccharide deacetylase family protein, partial [Mobilitalea sp.]|nr:polysaccharide deacetylase family protein [Mobilitalea sp.]
MKKFMKAGLLLLLFGLWLIYILYIGNKKNSQDSEQSEPALNQSTELLAVMENDMAQVNSDSQPSSKDQPDYTKLFPDLYTVFQEPEKMEKGKKVAFLTFDDGPSENTFKILDILSEYDVKATFFIVGHSISITDEADECLRRMINEGHTIGLHSNSHQCNKIYRSLDNFLSDYNALYQQIYDITGVRVNIYRMPLGSLNGYSKRFKDPLIEEMSRRGFTCYDWNVSANDSIGKP